MVRGVALHFEFSRARGCARAHLEPIEFQSRQVQEHRVAPVRRRGRHTIEHRRFRHENAVRTHLLQIKHFADLRFGADPNLRFFLSFLDNHNRLRVLQPERRQPARVRQQVLSRNVKVPVE